MIEIGEIYKVPLGPEDNVTPKDGYSTRNKYCVVIAKPDFGLVVAYLIIDHEINDKYNPTDEMKSNFYPVSRADYPSIILKCHDPSWVDMNEVREMSPERMESYGPPVANLTSRDFTNICDAIRSNDYRFSKKQRRRWGLIE